jgi:hypothetical protein
MPEFCPFWKSTASNISQPSEHFDNIICPFVMKIIFENIRDNIGDAFI